jgi:1-acyl-sn-glycerol-3-phosphate acyltransferase
MFYKIFLLIRAIIFWALSIVWLSITVTTEILSFAFPVQVRYYFGSMWAKGTITLARLICGLKYDIEGIENIPDGAAIVMSNHQSTWETLVYQKILPPQLWVVKKELLKVPVFGWGLALCEPIAIDRKAGSKAMTQLIEQGKQKLEQGRWIIIFPEGTRTAPGVIEKYRIGGAMLASKVDYPIVPIATNAGEHWPKHSLIKWPGTIKVVIGQPIYSNGRKAGEINKQVENWIRTKVAEISNPENWNRK